MTQTSTSFEIGKFATNVAYVSFGIGTLLFLANRCIPKVDFIIVSGVIYVILALIVNGCTFLALLYHFTIQKNYRDYYAVKMLLLLANIPVAAIYLYIIINNFTIAFF